MNTLSGNNTSELSSAWSLEAMTNHIEPMLKKRKKLSQLVRLPYMYMMYLVTSH